MQKVFNLTNKYIVVATPLILFSILVNIYIFMSASAGNKVINLVCAPFIIFLMCSAFISGWFGMIKSAIINPDRNEPNSLISEFPQYVGEYFLSSLGLMFILFLINLLLVVLIYISGMHFIGNPGISSAAFAKAAADTETLKTFIYSLPTYQLTKLCFWNLLIISGITFGYFTVFLYIPTLFFKTKNPIKAYFISLKNLLGRKIILNALLYFLIFVLYLLISLISALTAGNMLLSFLMTLVSFYFMSAAAIGVFYYYHNNFVKPQIGENVNIRI